MGINAKPLDDSDHATRLYGTEGVPRWYVVHTKPHSEQRVHHNLANQGIDTRCPMLAENYISRAGEAASRIVALFPGYLFARFSARQQWHSVRFTRGVRDVLCAEGRPVPVDDEVVRIVESRMGPHGVVRPTTTMQAGDSVVIRGGPFDGLIGVLERPADHDARLTVLLTLVSWSARVKVAQAHVYRT